VKGLTAILLVLSHLPAAFAGSSKPAGPTILFAVRDYTQASESDPESAAIETLMEPIALVANGHLIDPWKDAEQHAFAERYYANHHR
jgi:hypothetical protein